METNLLLMLVGMVVMAVIVAITAVIWNEYDKRRDRHHIWDEASGTYLVVKSKIKRGVVKIKGQYFPDGYFTPAPGQGIPNHVHPHRAFYWHHTGHPMVPRKRNGEPAIGEETHTVPAVMNAKDGSGVSWRDFSIYDAGFYQDVSETKALRRALTAYDEKGFKLDAKVLLIGAAIIAGLILLFWLTGSMSGAP